MFGTWRPAGGSKRRDRASPDPVSTVKSAATAVIRMAVFMGPLTIAGRVHPIASHVRAPVSAAVAQKKSGPRSVRGPVRADRSHPPAPDQPGGSVDHLAPSRLVIEPRVDGSWSG